MNTLTLALDGIPIHESITEKYALLMLDTGGTAWQVACQSKTPVKAWQEWTHANPYRVMRLVVKKPHGSLLVLAHAGAV